MSNLYFDEGQPASGQKVLLATTVYDTPAACYVFALQKTRETLHQAGIQTAYLLLQGNCHVDDARNNVVQHFLLTDCTDLVFLDADVTWQPEDLIKLCQAPADIIGGVYPYRREGLKDKLPVLVIPDVEPEDNGLLQVAGLPTGFMRIQRHVIETLAKDADHYINRAERRSKVPILFERTFEDGARWGGDITFCRKWHRKGGKIYALPDLRLGHAANIVMHDSLSAALRRQNDSTLNYMVQRIKDGTFDPYLFIEARQYLGNKWGALEDVLMMGAILAKDVRGPIIETGSGLSTLVMAAATDQPVYCLEHDREWAKKLDEMKLKTNVLNIDIVLCDIENDWYKLPNDLPGEFALGLNDGPPRDEGSRMGFFDHFGNTETIIVDDADDPGYGEWLSGWASQHDRRIDFIERSALIRSH